MRTNLRLIAAASAFAMAAIAAPASAADFDIAFGPNYVVAPAAGGGVATFTASGNPFSGPVTSGLSRSGVLAGDWTDRFIFRLGQDGFGSGSLTSVLTGQIGSSVDTTFLSASFDNGVSVFNVPVLQSGVIELASLANVPIFTGNTNILSLTFRSNGNGSYGGNLSFQPVPEPATWAMMLVGFAGIGFAMRRRRKQEVRVKYAY